VDSPDHVIWSTPVSIQSGIRLRAQDSFQGLISNQNGILLLFYPSIFDNTGFRVSRSYDGGIIFTEIVPAESNIIDGGIGVLSSAEINEWAQQWSSIYDAVDDKWIILIGPSNASPSSPDWRISYSNDDGVTWIAAIQITGIDIYPDITTNMNLQGIPSIPDGSDGSGGSGGSDSFNGMILSFIKEDQSEILSYYSSQGTDWNPLSPLVLDSNPSLILSIVCKLDPKTLEYSIQAFSQDSSSTIAKLYVATISSAQIVFSSLSSSSPSSPSSSSSSSSSQVGQVNWISIDSFLSFSMPVPKYIFYSYLSSDYRGNWMLIQHRNDQAGNITPFQMTTRSLSSMIWSSEVNMSTLASVSGLDTELGFIVDYIPESDKWIQVYSDSEISSGIRVFDNNLLFTTKAPTHNPSTHFPTKMPSLPNLPGDGGGDDGISRTILAPGTIETAIGGIFLPIILIAAGNVLFHALKYGDDMNGYHT
jgi:hypothetical protein